MACANEILLSSIANRVDDDKKEGPIAFSIKGRSCDGKSAEDPLSEKKELPSVDDRLFNSK